MSPDIPYARMRKWAEAAWEDRPAATSAGSASSDGEVAPAEPELWTNFLSRSRLSPVVFTVKKAREPRVKEALRSAGLPTLKWVSMFDSLYRSTPLVDGLVLEVGVYGFSRGLPSGMRVVGFRSMRALCLLLGIKGPSRRFKGEDHIPSETELLEAVREQAATPRQMLRAVAEQGLGISDASELRSLAQELFPS